MFDQIPVLNVNQAALNVTTNHTNLALWVQAVDCFKCDLIQRANITKELNTVFSSISNWNFELRDHNNTTLCKVSDANLGEQGLYQWKYTGECENIQTIKPPDDPFRPIYYFESILLGFVCLRLISKYFFKLIFNIRQFGSWSVSREIERDLGTPSDVGELITSSPAQVNPIRNKRIKSLDVFRGFTICLMIFVNYGGGQYWFFEHSPWNGLTIADVVFPWFAWIMGVGIAIKIKFDKRNSLPTKDLIIQCLRRSFMLILVGVILSNKGNNDLRRYRYFGVLQRLGTAYCFVTLLEIFFMEPQSLRIENVYLNSVRDLVESWKQWLIVLVCVVVHTIITFFWPVPGCPRGYLGPGGLGDHAQYSQCTGGAAGYIDRSLFGTEHLYSNPTCQKWYNCPIPYDPEGALGILTTILCVYLGVHAGRIILVYKRSSERIVRWMIASICCMTLTCMFSFGGVNEAVIPLNKNLWSLSYVLLCCSFAFLLLSLFYVLVDVKKWHSGSPLRQVGSYSLMIYVGHVITSNVFPWGWKAFYSSTHTEYFLMNTWGTFLWVVIGLFLFNNGRFAESTSAIGATNERRQ